MIGLHEQIKYKELLTLTSNKHLHATISVHCGASCEDKCLYLISWQIRLLLFFIAAQSKEDDM